MLTFPRVSFCTVILWNTAAQHLCWNTIFPHGTKKSWCLSNCTCEEVDMVVLRALYSPWCKSNNNHNNWNIFQTQAFEILLQWLLLLCFETILHGVLHSFLPSLSPVRLPFPPLSCSKSLHPGFIFLKHPLQVPKGTFRQLHTSSAAVQPSIN